MKTILRFLPAALICCLLAGVLAGRAHAAEPGTEAMAGTNAVGDAAAEAVRAELRVQTQAARLEAVESLMIRQQQEAREVAADFHRTLVTVAVIAVLGMATAVLGLAWLQTRGLRQVAEATAGSRLATAPPEWGAATPAGVSSLRLFEAVDRLEKRLRELEQTPHGPPATGSASVRLMETPDSAPAVGDFTAPLGKARALLAMGQGEAALFCFEEVLREFPRNAEALLGKGAALERLNRPDDALSCYDAALETDPTLTRAHLAKAAVFNQQERFGEALNCFEAAIRCQQRPAA